MSGIIEVKFKKIMTIKNDKRLEWLSLSQYALFENKKNLS